MTCNMGRERRLGKDEMQQVWLDWAALDSNEERRTDPFPMPGPMTRNEWELTWLFHIRALIVAC